MRGRIRAQHGKIFEAAVRDGQLPRGTDTALVQQVVFMPILMRALIFHEPVNDSVIREVVALVLEGAKARRSSRGVVSVRS